MAKDKERVVLQRAEKLTTKATKSVGKATAALPRVRGRAVRPDDLDRLGKALRQLDGAAKTVAAHVDRLRATLVEAATTNSNGRDKVRDAKSSRARGRAATTGKAKRPSRARPSTRSAQSATRATSGTGRSRARRADSPSAVPTGRTAPAARPLAAREPLQPLPPAPPLTAEPVGARPGTGMEMARRPSSRGSISMGR